MIVYSLVSFFVAACLQHYAGLSPKEAAAAFLAAMLVCAVRDLAAETARGRQRPTGGRG